MTASFIFRSTGAVLTVCDIYFEGVLETDYPAGEEVPQDLEASQGDVVSLAGSVASVGSTGSDGAMAAEGTTAIPQTASSGSADQAAEQSGICGSGSSLMRHCYNLTTISCSQTGNQVRSLTVPLTL